MMETETTSGRALVPYDPAQLQRDETTVSKGFWAKLRLTLGKAPFLEDATAAYYCARDPDTPLPVKATLMAALAYFVLPTDMIPDFVAGLGFTDDATVLFATLGLVSNHVRGRHRRRAKKALLRLGLKKAAA